MPAAMHLVCDTAGHPHSALRWNNEARGVRRYLCNSGGCVQKLRSLVGVARVDKARRIFVRQHGDRSWHVLIIDTPRASTLGFRTRRSGACGARTRNTPIRNTPALSPAIHAGRTRRFLLHRRQHLREWLIRFCTHTTNPRCRKVRRECGTILDAFSRFPVPAPARKGCA